MTDHYIPSADDQTIDNVVFLNPNKIVDSSIAYQSTLFEESVDLYYELSNLESASSSIDSGMSDIQEDGYFIGGVLGGRNIEFNAAIMTSRTCHPAAFWLRKRNPFLEWRIEL